MRDGFILNIANSIASMIENKPIILGIDGIDGAGKTTFAEELNVALKEKGIPTLRASIDGFHRPRAERIEKGEFSPEGYYQDSFDYKFLIENFLQPIKEFEKPVKVYLSKFDFRSDEASPNTVEVDNFNTVVIFEGVFLFRPELESYWDYKIFVDIDFETSLRRGLIRDSEWMGGDSITERKYRERYIPGQKMYLEEVKPKTLADLTFDNRHPERPQIIQ